MYWLGLSLDAFLFCLGIWLLLSGYRVIGKAAAVDPQRETALARQALTCKSIGWCIVAMSVIALLSQVFGS